MVGYKQDPCLDSLKTRGAESCRAIFRPAHIAQRLPSAGVKRQTCSPICRSHEKGDTNHVFNRKAEEIASVLEEVQDFAAAAFSAACHLPLFLEEIVMLSAFMQTLSGTDLHL